MTRGHLERSGRFTPAVGLLVAMADECRGRTLEALEALDRSMVDSFAPGHPNTIGSILYHIAAIELDWLYSEILMAEFPSEAFEGGWFPHDVREEDGRLTRVMGDSPDRHRERLAWVRSLLYEGMATLDDAALLVTRTTEAGTVTPEWVMHHLMQHEGEHRGQLMEIATALRAG